MRLFQGAFVSVLMFCISGTAQATVIANFEGTVRRQNGDGRSSVGDSTTGFFATDTAEDAVSQTFRNPDVLDWSFKIGDFEFHLPN